MGERGRLYKGRLYTETFRVTGVREVKCWTELTLQDVGRLTFRRSKTSRDLTAQLEGGEVEITAAELPPNVTTYIDEVKYGGRPFYSAAG